jgi:hypothetical protein
MPIFLVRSCLDVNSDSVHICTETAFLMQGISRAKSEAFSHVTASKRRSSPSFWLIRLGRISPMPLGNMQRSQAYVCQDRLPPVAQNGPRMHASTIPDLQPTCAQRYRKAMDLQWSCSDALESGLAHGICWMINVTSVRCCPASIFTARQDSTKKELTRDLRAVVVRSPQPMDPCCIGSGISRSRRIAPKGI